MAEEISKERQERFWLACGWRWWKAGDMWAYGKDEVARDLPPVQGYEALAPLFKYGLAKDATIQFQQHGDTTTCVIYFTQEWYSGEDKDPGTSLFLALEKVLVKKSDEQISR